MEELTKRIVAHRIWNRACLEDVSDLREGDRALAAMILADSYVWNGGVLNVVEILDVHSEFEEAIEAFRYFGSSDVADFLIEARTIYLTEEDLSEYEVALNERYWALLPNNGAELTPRFEAVLLEKPWVFAPLPA
ncbi:hypothetical protein BH10PSE6_BH10PSE6_30490 [soil metagenome]